jgi:hypothetical protein
MNWLHFLIWIAGIYAAYYLANILIDAAGSGRSPADNSQNNELTFSETVQPQRPEHGPETENKKNNKPSVADTVAKPKPVSEVIASGGVPIKDLFNLVRQEVIIYTRAVSY